MTDYRRIRNDLLLAFDIYKSNVFYGIEKETTEEHEEIMNWYQSMLDLPDTEAEYKSTPDRIKQYLPKIGA